MSGQDGHGCPCPKRTGSVMRLSLKLFRSDQLLREARSSSNISRSQFERSLGSIAMSHNSCLDMVFQPQPTTGCLSSLSRVGSSAMLSLVGQKGVVRYRPKVTWQAEILRSTLDKASEAERPFPNAPLHTFESTRQQKRLGPFFACFSTSFSTDLISSRLMRCLFLNFQELERLQQLLNITSLTSWFSKPSVTMLDLQESESPTH